MSEGTHDTAEPLPEAIPTVNAVEFAAAMTEGWNRQTDRLEEQTTRIVRAVMLWTALAVVALSGTNWGVQYRLSRSALLLESTRANVVETQTMLKSLQEDRRTDEARFRTLMAAVASVGQQADRFRQERERR